MTASYYVNHFTDSIVFDNVTVLFTYLFICISDGYAYKQPLIPAEDNNKEISLCFSCFEKITSFALMSPPKATGDAQSVNNPSFALMSPPKAIGDAQSVNNPSFALMSPPKATGDAQSVNNPSFALMSPPKATGDAQSVKKIKILHSYFFILHFFFLPLHYKCYAI